MAGFPVGSYHYVLSMEVLLVMTHDTPLLFIILRVKGDERELGYL